MNQLPSDHGNGNDQENGPAVGALLRATRLRIGEDLHAIADMLHIRYPYLEAIEEGRYGDLPGPAYAVGFVRAYAHNLGLDSDEVVRRFKTETSGIDRKADLQFPSPIPEGGVPGGAVLFVGVMVALLAYGGWYLSTSQDEFFAEIVSPLPERLTEKLAANQATPDRVPTGHATQATAAPTDGDREADGIESPQPVAEDATAAREPGDGTGAPAIADDATTRVDTPAASTPEPATASAPAGDQTVEATAAVESPATTATAESADGSASAPTATAEEGVAGDAPAALSSEAGSQPVGGGETGSPASEQVAAVAPDRETAEGPAVAPDRENAEGPPAEASETSAAAGSPDSAPMATTPPPSSSPSGDWEFSASGRSPVGAAPTTAPAAAEAPTEPAAAETAQAPTEPAAAETAQAPTAEASTEPTEPTAAEAAEAPPPADDGDPAPDVAATVGSEESDRQLAAAIANVRTPAGEPASRIVVRARTASWIQVRDDNANRLLLTRLMRPGDVYRVPDRAGLTLLTGNAGALEILVDGEAVPPLGPVGLVRRDVALDAERLRAGTAVRD